MGVGSGPCGRDSPHRRMAATVRRYSVSASKKAEWKCSERCKSIQRVVSDRPQITKRTKMKTISQMCKSAARFGLAAAVVGLLAAPLGSSAQVPKGGEKLMQLQKINTLEALQSVEAGDTIVMSCPKCKDTYATVVEKSFKGTREDQLKTVTIHLCSACDTKLVTKGHGKSAQTVAVHTCKACGSKDVSCCVMKKGAGPTPGMEQK
jgi:hypothetical protein